VKGALPSGAKGRNSGAEFTSRLQKGGALLEDMRRLVSAWSEDVRSSDAVPVVMRVLGKSTLPRAKDTYVRAFKPRFVNGNPPNAWKLARPLEDANAAIEVVRPLYYWITARAERPLYEFVTMEMHEGLRSPGRTVTVEEVMLWLEERLRDYGKKWTPTIRRKVSRGILAALRDFGFLEGRVRKKMVPYHVPLPSLVWIAQILSSLQSQGRALVEHPDWGLFLMDESDVERRFLEAHQMGWLNYQAAGRVVRFEFPTLSLEDYAHAILG